MNLKTLNIVAAIAAVASATLPSQAATPQVTSVTMTQPGPTRLVKIDYTFTGADAVITLDVQTNAPGGAWASIGGAAVCNAQGEVWKKVTNDDTTHRITWRPDLSWPDHIIADGGARAVITAWTLDNTPDYMVVDISASAQQNTEKYYPAVEFLPGGLLGNPDYRTTSIVMRKIMAKDVEWTMGSTLSETQRDATREMTHKVKLTNNYYIGVFEVTQDQWMLLKGTNPSVYKNAEYRAIRPVEAVTYNEIRNSSSSENNAEFDYPAYPNPSSYLGLLYLRTGIRFDLPSEAQWEFAARAGNGNTKYGDGSGIQNKSGNNSDTNLDLLGRYSLNGGMIKSGNSYVEPSHSCGPTNGTAIVGSYKANDWGVYDMHGNVWEWCVDWYADDITSLNGVANTTAQVINGNTLRIKKGGACTHSAEYSRPAYRYRGGPSNTSTAAGTGFRVMCYAGLQ